MARPSAPGALALAVLAAVAVAMALSVDGTRDYRFDAHPGIAALARGDLDAFFLYQPLMGSFSVLLRAPVAFVMGSGAGELAVYRAGIVPLLLAGGILGMYLARVARRRGESLATQAVLAAACMASPPAFSALAWGHPEEVLGAALAVGAVVAALRERGLLAIVLLGLALATKQWALVAVGPVLLAWPGSRLRLAAGAAAVAGAFTVPMALVRPDRFLDVLDQASVAHGVTSAVSVWWPLASAERSTNGTGAGAVEFTRYVLPDWVMHAGRPLAVLIPLGLAALIAARRGARAREGALALLALALLLRCALDPVDNVYYHAPLIAAIAAWEVHARRGLPVVTLAAAAGHYLIFEHVTLIHEPALTNAVYLAWATALGAYLARAAWSPPTLDPVRAAESAEVSRELGRALERTPA